MGRKWVAAFALMTSVGTAAAGQQPSPPEPGKSLISMQIAPTQGYCQVVGEPTAICSWYVPGAHECSDGVVSWPAHHRGKSDVICRLSDRDMLEERSK